MSAQTYDLLLSGGRVIDPAQGIDRVADVAIVDGKIAAIGDRIDPDAADVSRDVAGLYVCPGLVDLHGHWYDGSAFGIDPHICLNTGVTTAVDAGTTGYVAFPSFRRHVIDVAALQVLAFVHVSCLGIPTTVVGELEDLRFARPVETASIIDQHRDVALGVKIRAGDMSAGDGVEALEMAIAAAETVTAPVMVHVSPRAGIRRVLERLRPGDIVTHCFHGRRDAIFGPGETCLITEATAARKRGVLFDVGHGRGSFRWDAALRAFEHSFYPDTISTDLHRFCVGGPVYDLPTTLSKFLCLGMTLNDVILKATWAPACAIGRENDLGTLRPGTTADLFVFDVAHGDVEFFDTHDDARTGDRKIVPALTIKSGKIVRPGEYPVELRRFELADEEYFERLRGW